MDTLVKMMDKIEFPNLFSGSLNINRVAFSIFGLDIYWYGIIIAVGVILAFSYGMKRARQVGLLSDEVFDVAFISIIAGFIGARAYYCIFIDSKINFFDTRHGGLAIYGGIILGVVACVIVCKLRKINVPALLDLGGLGFLIGQCIGRWGNFVNQEAYGAPTAGNLPWGMTGTNIENEVFASTGITDQLVHPCFLYESLWCLIGFLVLHFYSKKLRTFDGEIFLLYVAWYGLGRGWIEGLRTDSLYIGPLRVSQVVAIASFIFATGLFIFFKIKLKASKGYVLCKDKEATKVKFENFDKQVAIKKEVDAAKKAIKEKCEPVAPSILAEDADEIEDITDGTDSGDNTIAESDSNEDIDTKENTDEDN